MNIPNIEQQHQISLIKNVKKRAKNIAKKYKNIM